ncbi:hypothetical protein TNIN_15781 [Trichonephila inaurata madagascariensis]|uniref:Uncharacterized protein n=1 Tax=Trichonephila inaurata madagascariensis TaxID=2747483 RepID=A0A8X7CL61_9ARAC|nr:hypothetical protein TNIN_15781 [Trichonephila inaurata madagascariensis]
MYRIVATFDTGFGSLTDVATPFHRRFSSPPEEKAPCWEYKILPSLPLVKKGGNVSPDHSLSVITVPDTMLRFSRVSPPIVASCVGHIREEIRFHPRPLVAAGGYLQISCDSIIAAIPPIGKNGSRRF